MILETDRLILRHWGEEDAIYLYKYASNPKVGPIAGWPPHKGIEESKHIINTLFNTPECFALCLKEDNKPIGCIDLRMKDATDMTDRDDECELGYWLGEPFWGQGYMPEAARIVVEHAFTDLHMTTIWCGYYEGNLQSKRVQEKVGFVYDHTSTDLKVPAVNEIRIGHVSKLTKQHWLKIKEYI